MSPEQNIVRRIRIWFRKPIEPQDPHAYLTADLKRGPGGGSAAVVLEEPEPRRRLNVSGRRLTR